MAGYSFVGSTGAGRAPRGRSAGNPAATGLRGQRRPARQATVAMFGALPVPPTAVFACSDAMAVGVFQALAGLGLRVPGDVSVIGFDDSVAAVHVTPALTTVRRPWPELGAAALAAPLPGDPPVRVEPPTGIVVRHSTASV
ncbi:substrate-binding domain-containing protein [Streptosporangium sp. NPDC048047]|uniref:substrate-binding domain-containing protein n=1 Tax=Streptosporangium sp. NPDC048047 TaxID=3155748 RepID=UPI0034454C52